MSVVVAYFVCAVIWGTTWFAIRVCVGPDGYPPLFGAALRFVLSTAILLPPFLLGKLGALPARRSDTAWLCVAGLINSVGFCLVYTAETYVSGAVAAVLYGTAPLMTAGLAVATRTERVSRGSLVGAVISLIGILVIFWDRSAQGTAQGLAVAMLLGSVFLSCVYNIVAKRHSRGAAAMATTFVFIAATGAGLVVASLLFERTWPSAPRAAATGALIYLSLGSVVVFGAYFYLLANVSLMTASTLVFVFPLIALGVDAVWESSVVLPPRFYLGALLAVIGVAIAARAGRAQALRVAATAATVRITS